jgi:hypothetical protein
MDMPTKADPGKDPAASKYGFEAISEQNFWKNFANLCKSLLNMDLRRTEMAALPPSPLTRQRASIGIG